MSQLVNQPSAAPTRKMNAVAIGGVIGAIAVGSIRRWAPEFDAPGITDFIMFTAPVVVGWVAGWFTRERA